MTAFIKKGKRPGIDSLLVASQQSSGFPPQAVAAEYQYGTHDAAIKGSKAAGYGSTFGAFLALVPLAPQFPVIHSTLGQRQELAEPNQSAIYSTTTRNQRPLIRPIITTPQVSQEIAPSAVFRLKKFLQPQLMGNWNVTWPQASQFQAPSAVFKFPPATLALASPPLRNVILTRAETPLNVRSHSLVITPYLPSFVGAAPPPHSGVQLWPQEPSAINVTYSFVSVPTAAKLPSVAPTPVVRRKGKIVIDKVSREVIEPKVRRALSGAPKTQAIAPEKPRNALTPKKPRTIH